MNASSAVKMLRLLGFRFSVAVWLADEAGRLGERTLMGVTVTSIGPEKFTIT